MSGSLRDAERIMASVQDAKRKQQAETARKQVTKQQELFPEAIKAAKHRMQAGKGAEPGTGGG